MKAYTLKPGDTIAIVSLSDGILGEPYVEHQLKLGQERLEAYGYKVQFMAHALKGRAYLDKHPESRAQDLKEAFVDPNIRAILCAIGGQDTFRTLPYLMEDAEFLEAVKKQPKIFIGFSDTTVNHFMFHRLGLNTFYGQAFLSEWGELSAEMLPYSRAFAEALLLHGELKEIPPAYPAYRERSEFGVEQLGTSRQLLLDHAGYEVLNGSGQFEGELLGGCIETLYDMYTGSRYPEEPEMIEKYQILPSAEEWQGKILFLESSESKSEPHKLQKMLELFQEKGLFDGLSGLLVGKPQDDVYYEEYKDVYQTFFENTALSVVYNVNVGHALPRALLPFGVHLLVDGTGQKITVTEPVLRRGQAGHLDFYCFQTQIGLDLGAFQKDYIEFSKERIDLMLARVAVKGRRALELGAGVGLEAICLAQAGYDVRAIDFAPEAHQASLKHQEQYETDVSFVQGDFYQVPFGEGYDLIYYLDGFGVGSDADKLTLLKKCRQHLLPGGQMYIEVYQPSFWERVAGTAYAFSDRLSRAYSYNSELHAMVDTWTDKETRIEESQILACYTPEEFTILAEAAGLSVVELYPGGAMDYETWVYEEEVPLDECMSYAVVLKRQED